MENYIIRKKYLAESMAFLGYRYWKEGFGEDTKYIFKDTEQFRRALTGLMQLKKEVGQHLK